MIKFKQITWKPQIDEPTILIGSVENSAYKWPVVTMFHVNGKYLLSIAHNITEMIDKNTVVGLSYHTLDEAKEEAQKFLDNITLSLLQQ